MYIHLFIALFLHAIAQLCQGSGNHSLHCTWPSRVSSKPRQNHLERRTWLAALSFRLSAAPGSGLLARPPVSSVSIDGPAFDPALRRGIRSLRDRPVGLCKTTPRQESIDFREFERLITGSWGHRQVNRGLGLTCGMLRGCSLVRGHGGEQGRGEYQLPEAPLALGRVDADPVALGLPAWPPVRLPGRLPACLPYCLTAWPPGRLAVWPLAGQACTPRSGRGGSTRLGGRNCGAV